MAASPDLDHPPVVIRQARWKALLLVVGSLAFLAVGIAMQADAAVRGKAQLIQGFFGLGLLVGLAQLVSPGRLVLEPTGLTQTVLWRTRRWAWTDVSGFREWRYRRTRLITFDDANAKPGMLQAANAALGAGTGALSGTWALSRKELLALLVEAERRWGRR